MNSRRSLALAGLVGLALTGCGGSSGKTATPAISPTSLATSDPTATPSPTAAPSPTETALDAESATKLAAAAVLLTTDLPGYDVQSQDQSAANDPTEAESYACLGAKQPTYLARDAGRSFTLGPVEIDSSADVVASSSIAKADLAAQSGPKAVGCYRKLVAAEFASSGPKIKISSLTISPVSVTVPDADGAFGFRLDLKGTSGGQAVQLSGYQLGTAVGPAEVSVGSFVEGSGGPSLAQLEALLDKATARAKAAGTAA